MGNRGFLSRVAARWNALPEQIRRLSVVVIVFVAVVVPVRRLLVPRDFGKLGHYRATTLNEIASLDMLYASHEKCTECHDDVVKIKNDGYHKGVACEVCHGAATDHANDPETVKPRAPRDRSFCPVCHEYLASRPTGFPQIVSASHNPMKPCITCHNPHDPVPPERPAECSACHAAIARTKALSNHVYVPCTRCHGVPEKHVESPREYRATKPTSRDLCGSCHGQNAPDAEGAIKVDMATHGGRYVCWQCHYPHLPEAR